MPGLLLLGLLLLGCGSRSDLLDESLEDAAAALYPWQEGAHAAPVRSPRSCAEDWRTLYETDGEAPMPGSIAVSAGEVIFAASDGATWQMLALDIEAPARSPRVVHTGSTYDPIWLQGNELLFAGRYRIVSLPLQGGPEQVLFDVRRLDPSAQIDSVVVQGDLIYWTELTTQPIPLQVWQQRRDGGERSLVASVERSAPQQRLLWATKERVIVTGHPSAQALPLGGGASQTLAAVAEGSLAGADGLGVYYERPANRTRRGGRALEFEIQRSPADGSPSAPFWRGSAGQRLGRVWPTESGWLAIGAWYMFDNRPHAVLAHLDASGDAELIACDRGDNALIGRPVFWEGAFYAVTRAGNRSRIVEIRLDE